MVIKAIMVDVDGVLLVHPDPAGWQVHLERDLGVCPEKLQRQFFQKHWSDVVCGHADLRQRLAPVLAEMVPNVTCDQLLEYWFKNDAHVNSALLNDLQLLRERSIELHLATIQEHERARFLWENLSFQSHFDGMHYSASLGSAKPDIAFFKEIEGRTGFRSDEIFFIDDKVANVEGAKQAGWTAALWTPATRLQDLLPEIT
jgi:putative hydrolase of the HAD superfamily